jgi:uncharacterized alpha/beta hydrolase family protein
MENLFTALINFVLEFVNGTLGLSLTFMQVVVILVIVLIVLLIVTSINLNRKKAQLKKLRSQVINKQIQVITVQKGKKGKTKQVIRTMDQLRNPKKNHQETIRTGKKHLNKGVTNIKED